MVRVLNASDAAASRVDIPAPTAAATRSSAGVSRAAITGRACGWRSGRASVPVRHRAIHGSDPRRSNRRHRVVEARPRGIATDQRGDHQLAACGLERSVELVEQDDRAPGRGCIVVEHAATACCDRFGPAPTGRSGLTVELIDETSCVPAAANGDECLEEVALPPQQSGVGRPAEANDVPDPLEVFDRGGRIAVGEVGEPERVATPSDHRDHADRLAVLDGAASVLSSVVGPAERGLDSGERGIAEGPAHAVDAAVEGCVGGGLAAGLAPPPGTPCHLRRHRQSERFDTAERRRAGGRDQSVVDGPGFVPAFSDHQTEAEEFREFEQRPIDSVLDEAAERVEFSEPVGRALARHQADMRSDGARSESRVVVGSLGDRLGSLGERNGIGTDAERCQGGGCDQEIHGEVGALGLDALGLHVQHVEAVLDRLGPPDDLAEHVDRHRSRRSRWDEASSRTQSRDRQDQGVPASHDAVPAAVRASARSFGSVSNDAKRSHVAAAARWAPVLLSRSASPRSPSTAAATSSGVSHASTRCQA